MIGISVEKGMKFCCKGSQNIRHTKCSFLK